MKRMASTIVGAAAMVAAMTVAQAQEKKPLQVQETNFEGVSAEVTPATIPSRSLP